MQCKGKGDPITPLIRFPDYVSCDGITRSNIQYLGQDNSAVILTYASIRDRNNFYYAELKDIITEEQLEAMNNGPADKRITVRIPVSNNAKDNIDGFFELINRYYS